MAIPPPPYISQSYTTSISPTSNFPPFSSNFKFQSLIPLLHHNILLISPLPPNPLDPLPSSHRPYIDDPSPTHQAHMHRCFSSRPSSCPSHQVRAQSPTPPSAAASAPPPPPLRPPSASGESRGYNDGCLRGVKSEEVPLVA